MTSALIYLLAVQWPLKSRLTSLRTCETMRFDLTGMDLVFEGNVFGVSLLLMVLSRGQEEKETTEDREILMASLD